MPCIQIKTNVKVSKSQADTIKADLGRSISLLPGKTEEWLMVVLLDDCFMYFGGNDGRPMAVVEVKILGDSIDPAAAGKMTGKVTDTIEKNLGVARDDMYIKYEASPDWGWNGTNF